MKIIGRVSMMVCLLFTYINSVYSEIRNLEEYPLKKTILLGVDEGLVKNAQTKYYHINHPSEVTFLRGNMSLLRKGDHWATIDVDKLEYHKRALDHKLHEYERNLSNLKKAEKLLVKKKQSEIAILENEKNKLSRLINEENFDKIIIQRVNERISEIEDSIRTTLQEISQERLKDDLSFEKEKLDLTLEKDKREYDEKEKKAKLVAPFSGELKLNLIKNKNVPFVANVDGNQLLATLKDDSFFEVICSNNSLFRKEELSSLFLQIRLQGKASHLYADFKETRTEGNAGSLKDVLAFTVGEESLAEAKVIEGETYVIHIMKRLPDDCHVVRKRDIALLHSDILKEKGWRGLTKYLWPSSKLIVEGSYELALQITSND